MSKITCITAWCGGDKIRGIGLKGKIPWVLKKDMEYFRNTTLDNIVIMGRKTFESLNRPLKQRINVVLTRKSILEYLSILKTENPVLFNEYMKSSNTLFFYDNYNQAISEMRVKYPNKIIYIIGGSEIYKEAISNDCDEILVTEIYNDYICDTFFPELPSKYILNILGDIQNDSGVLYRFSKYSLRTEGEMVYLELLKKIIDKGELRETRNSKTLSLFGEHLVINTESSFPLLTTKKMFFKGVVEELLWFLRGDTNAKHLQEVGVHIWDGNSSREFLDKSSKDYKEGDCGPIYGFQWRRFGEKYVPLGTNTESFHSKKGIDQIKECLNLIKSDPTSRRILLSAWNPEQLNEMVLPPCHVSYQWYVREGKFLDCHLYQRSCDAFLGLPFNLASTALLTMILIQQSNKNLKLGRIIMSFGDVHIYENHLEAVKTQLVRKPYPFPKLEISQHDSLPQLLSQSSSSYKDCIKDDWKYEDFQLSNYIYYPAIKAELIP